MTREPASFVAVETPRGDTRVGRVTDAEWEASVQCLHRVLTVDLDGVRLRVPEPDAVPV